MVAKPALTLQQRKYWTIAEVGEHLRVTREMVHKLLRERKLRKLKVGRRTLIPATSVAAFERKALVA